MPRSASTYFQQAVFPHIEGFQFVGIETAHYGAAFQHLMYQDDSGYDFDWVKKELAYIYEKNTLISNEVFVGQSLYLSSTNRSRTAQRLKDLFPEAEIMLFIRNQVSLLQSLYSIAVYGGYSEKIEKYIKFTESCDDGKPFGSFPTYEQGEATGQYYYTEVIEAFSKHFEKMHLFLFEDFAGDSDSFLADMAARLDVKIHHETKRNKVNSSLSERQLRLFRMLNVWRPLLQSTRFGRWIFKIKVRFIEHTLSNGSTYKMDTELASRLRQHYRADNQKLLTSKPELNSKRNFKKYYS
jgi:hypothetical protein